MGGSRAVDWTDALEASFEAGLAREEEVAAADLAFSLRQDVSLRDALARSATGWTVVTQGAAAAAVDEVGVDYVRAGSLLVPSTRAVTRSTGDTPPRVAETRLSELLGTACRAGAQATIATAGATSTGRLVRVAQDHVALRNEDTETVVGAAAVEWIRLRGYSASRGFSG